jgi:anti-sigma factor RsiW
MVTCRLYQNELSAYMDGELPGTRIARLEAHLRVCPHCQGELQEMTGISTYIRAASHQLTVSQDFDQRVLRAVTSYQVGRRVQRRQQSRLRPLVAVAIALLALLGLIQHFLFGPPTATPLPQPSAATAIVTPAGPAPALPGQSKR